MTNSPRISEIVSNIPIFADCDEEGLVKTAEACGKILSADDGVQQVLRLVQEALPEKLRETAYCVALEVAVADRLVRPGEIFFLDMLGDALGSTARPPRHWSGHPRPQHDTVNRLGGSRARALLSTGQTLAYFYARENDHDANTAGVEDGRGKEVGEQLAKLPTLLGKGD